MENKRKRNSLSIDDRLKIIEKLEAGVIASKLADEYNVSQSAISVIKRRKASILEMKKTLETCEGNLKQKRYKGVEKKPLEKEVYAWFIEHRSSGYPVTGPMIQKQAFIINRNLGGPDTFKASTGWLNRFKLRHGIKFSSELRERLSPNSKSANKKKNFSLNSSKTEQLLANDEHLDQKLLQEVDDQCMPTASIGSEVEKSLSTINDDPPCSQFEVNEKTMSFEYNFADQGTSICQPITIPISTRGIGMGLSYVYSTLIRYKNTDYPNIYSVYRASLAGLETKLQLNRSKFPWAVRYVDEVYEYESSNIFLNACKSTSFYPDPIRRIINTVGVLNYKNNVYLPALKKDKIAANGRFIPRPENIILSNLRKVVEALASPQTPLQRRQAFFEHNSIPGAIWNDQYLLENADEIMPPSYKYDIELIQDIGKIYPLMYELQKYAPKLCTGPLDFDAPGRVSLFVSNKQQGLYIPNRGNQGLQIFYQNILPRGKFDEYYSIEDLLSDEVLEGQINLLGEMPYLDDVKYPFYCLRSDVISGIRYNADYISACRTLYNT